MYLLYLSVLASFLMFCSEPYSKQTVLAVVEFGLLQSNLSHLTFIRKLWIGVCFQAPTPALDGIFFAIKNNFTLK